MNACSPYIFFSTGFTQNNHFTVFKTFSSLGVYNTPHSWFHYRYDTYFSDTCMSNSTFHEMSFGTFFLSFFFLVWSFCSHDTQRWFFSYTFKVSNTIFMEISHKIQHKISHFTEISNSSKRFSPVFHLNIPPCISNSLGPKLIKIIIYQEIKCVVHSFSFSLKY